MDSRLDDLQPDENIFIEHDHTSNYYNINELNTEFEDLPGGNYLIFNENIRIFNTNGEHFKKFLVSLKLSLSFVILTETWNNENNIDLSN